MSAVIGKAVNDRLTLAALVGVLLLALGVMVGALWPPLQETFANLALPEAFSNILGGATLTTPIGWTNAELVSVVAPAGAIVVGVISGARATAGEEEDKTLGMLLATPVDRIPFLLAKTVAMIVHVLTVALLLVAGLAVADPLGDLGITTLGMLGAGLHTAALAILFGVIAVIVGSASGSRRLTNAVAGGLATLAFAMNSFLPLSDSLAGLAKLSPWYYFNSGDPLANGPDLGQLLVLGTGALVILALGLGVFNRRDLRG